MANFDYHVELISFPSGKVHETVCRNEDMSFTIFLDKNDTFENQQRRFQHAMKHISGSDFEKESVQEIESDAHSKEGRPEI